MNLKHTPKELFTFSKKERVAIIVLLLTILIVTVIPFYNFGSKPSENQAIDSSIIIGSDQLNKMSEANKSDYEKSETFAGDFQADETVHAKDNRPKEVLFPFDPNILNEEGLKKLGLRDKTIKTILNYRGKGGKFRKPEDFKKIYNLRQEEFDRLKPYIAIESVADAKPYNNNSNNDKSYNTYSASVSENKPKYQRKIIEVNAADAAAYESLYGIGSKLASRIINFREKLGGFYSIDQVGETYGVPDSTFQKIKSQLQVNPLLIRKVNVNTAGYDDLNNHPYINKQTAYLILKYKKEKGGLTLETVKEIVSKTHDQFEKMSPYITTD